MMKISPQNVIKRRQMHCHKNSTQAFKYHFFDTKKMLMFMNIINKSQTFNYLMQLDKVFSLIQFLFSTLCIEALYRGLKTIKLN